MRASKRLLRLKRYMSEALARLDCMGKTVTPGLNDLATQRPELMQSWLAAKNLPLKPSEVSFGSSKLVWWSCELGHEWQAVISNRSKGVGCPVCAGKKVLFGFNDLRTKNPLIAAEWHPSKNSPLSPETIMASSNKNVWWMCSRGHEWQTTPNARRAGRGCPICANKSVTSGQNDLATTNPELAQEFDAEKNGNLTASALVAGSNKKIWWRCKQGHSWQNTVNNRTRGQGCPYCSGRKVVEGKTDLATLNPALAAEWVAQRNSPLTIHEVSTHSGKKVWWCCAKGHEWQAVVQDRSNGSGCPICSGKRVFPGFNDLLSQRPDLAAELARGANGSVDGSEVSLGSNRKYLWVCTLGHQFEASVNKRALGQGCPYCSNTKVLAGFNDLESQYPELAMEVHPTKNSPGIGRLLVGKSNKKLWWLCSDGHEWQTTPEHRLRGRGCPTCAVTGYVPTRPGYFYFISNSTMAARKVGIANLGSDRLATFGRAGWRVIAKWESDDGLQIQTLETQILRWIRKDLGLPQFLTKQDMGKAAGWSETFSDEGPSNLVIKNKIDEVYAKLAATSSALND